MSIKVKVANFLKSSAFGRWVYPLVQKTYRAYAIPAKRRRLFRYGFATLQRLHNTLQDNNIPYYCDYGTLLGFIRDGGFMPHDDDIDISIPPGSVPIHQVLIAFLNTGFKFVHGFNYQGRFLEFTVVDISGITIDVFFPSLIDGDAMNVFCYQPVWFKNIVYPNIRANTLIEYVFIKAKDLKKICIQGVETFVPGNHDEVLTSEYGAWQIKKSKFDTVKDRKHRQMPGFAYRVSKEDILTNRS